MELRKDFLAYLQRICKVIQNHMSSYYILAHPDLASTNLIDTKYAPEHLFIWSKYNTKIRDTNEKIIESLKKYLFKEFAWRWIQNANVTLNFDDNKIELQDDKHNYAIIIISPKTKTAILRNNNITYSNLFKIFIEEQTISFEGKGPIAKDSLDPGFLFECQKELISLLFSFQSRSNRNEKLKNILTKDPKYRKTIDEMIRILKLKDV
jgi:hypothetical protein